MAKRRARKTRGPSASRPQTRMAIRVRELRKLERPGRTLTAEDVVAAASNPDHPLYQDFEWDDSVAGHKYRVQQARTMIAEVRVVITTSTKKLSVVGYIRDPRSAPGPGYVATAELRTESEAAQEALLNETTQLQARLERVREIATALELEAQLEAILTAVLDLRSRLRRGKAQQQEENRITT